MSEIINNLHLLRPLWLLGIIPGLLLSWFFLHQRRRALNWRGAISESLLQHLVDSGENSTAARWRSHLPWYALALGWVLSCVALAGPSWEKLPQPVHQRQDALVIVLDLSLSMLAEDIQPARVARARHKILDILAQRSEGLTALIAYSGDAHIVAPLTDDQPTIANLTPALAPGMMPLFGSDPVAALQLAAELLSNAKVPRGKILLISDGVSERDLEQIGNSVQAGGHQLSILGGGPVNNTPIPTANGFLKDNSGTIIVPQLHRQHLEDLAQANAGRYTDVSLGGDDISFLLPDTGPELSDESESVLSDRLFDQWQDRGALLILLLLPLALLAFRRGWLLVLPLLLVIEPNNSQALEWDQLWQRPDQRGSQALDRGDAKAAAKLFEDSNWRATANYQAGDYKAALGDYQLDTSAQGHYNRGNALAKAGQYKKAIAAYSEALSQQPKLEDAAFNKDLLEKLQQQQEEQQQEEQEQEEQDQQEQDQQEQQDGEQDGEPSEENEQQDADSQDQQDGEQDGDPSEQDQQQDQQAPEDPAEPEQDAEPQQPTEQEQEQEKTEREAQQQELTEAEQLDQQQQQAMEQWLRKIPDEPAGLLRRKFDYESRLRQQRGDNQQDQPQW